MGACVAVFAAFPPIPLISLSASISGRTLSLQLLGGMVLRPHHAIARLRKRLRILPLTEATWLVGATLTVRLSHQCIVLAFENSYRHMSAF